MTKWLYALSLGIIGAILVHIAIILLIPHWTGSALWSQLKQECPPYQFSVLPPQNPIAKTADPFFKQRICRFDLAQGPVFLNAKGRVPFWSLAVYNQRGETVYSVTGHASSEAELNLIFINPVELMNFKHNLPEFYTDTALTALNGGHNFAILRVLLPSPDWEKQVQAFFAAAKCRPADY